jgi:hypothetical protein
MGPLSMLQACHVGVRNEVREAHVAGCRENRYTKFHTLAGPVMCIASFSLFTLWFLVLPMRTEVRRGVSLGRRRDLAGVRCHQPHLASSLPPRGAAAAAAAVPREAE